MKKLYTILIIVLIATQGFAQKDIFYLNYSPSIPLGETSDYTSEMTWRGFGFGYGKFINQNIAIGIDLSWSVYDEQFENETLIYNNLTITGLQNRYINTVPLHLTVQYYIGESDLKFLVGAGIGTSWTEKITEMGIYSLTNSEWQFSMAPEIGVVYSLTDKIQPFFKLKYFYSTKNKDFESVSHLNFVIGFAIN
jgi:opacity protein-like surface antigen